MPKITTVAVAGTITTTLGFYTVPAGSTFVVRFINVANITSGAVTVTVGTDQGGGGAQVNFLSAVNVPAHTTLQYPQYMPVPAGGRVEWAAGANSSIDLYVTGDLISLG